MEELLSCVEITPPTVKASVIWLHGLGADGHDFKPIVPSLGLSPDDGVRFVFPHAPMRAVTINNGYHMPAWFDIKELDMNATIDMVGLEESQKQLEALIAHENELGVPDEKIILAGFSQGGAVALHTGLHYPKRFAGILGLSTFLPYTEEIPQAETTPNQQTSIFLTHGTEDSIIPLKFGEISRDRLQQLGYNVTWRTYPMQHEVSYDEIKDIASWLRQVVLK